MNEWEQNTLEKNELGSAVCVRDIEHKQEQNKNTERFSFGETKERQKLR